MTDPTPEPPPEPAVKPQRRHVIPTPALYSLLLVLGLIGGICAGYAVQWARKPTPLPSLAVAQPIYPQSATFTGQAPPSLPSADDDATITNGNLTTVLLPTPSGATVIPGLDHTWQTLADLAANCPAQVYCLNQELTAGVARIAETGWSLSDGTSETITITQYFPGSSDKASQDFSADTAADASAIGGSSEGSSGSTSGSTSGGTSGVADTTAIPLPGLTGTDAAGYSYTFTDIQGNPEYADFMAALHGTLLVEIQVWSSSVTPPTSVVDDLISQQLARL